MDRIELNVRVGDVWRRKRNGRLVTVTNPRYQVGANYHDIQYLIQADGRMGYTSSLYWGGSFELVERAGKKQDRDEIQLGNTLAYALESGYGHEQLARLVLDWMKAHGYEKSPEPEWEYGEMNAMGGVWPIKPDLSPELWASTPTGRRRRRVAPGPWVAVEGGEQG